MYAGSATFLPLPGTEVGLLRSRSRDQDSDSPSCKLNLTLTEKCKKLRSSPEYEYGGENPKTPKCQDQREDQKWKVELELPSEGDLVQGWFLFDRWLLRKDSAHRLTNETFLTSQVVPTLSKED